MNAIETTYKAYKFRSRLEAKWACMFDQLGWDWEYEPIDLDGYIPDFHIDFGNEQWYVEIKPATTNADFSEAIKKAWKSRDFDGDTYRYKWDESLLVLGARLLLPQYERVCSEGVEILACLQQTSYGGDYFDVHLVSCPVCSRAVPVTDEGSWNMPCCDPPHDSNESIKYWPHKHWRWARPVDRDDIKDMWAHAHNATKWKPRAR